MDRLPPPQVTGDFYAAAVLDRLNDLHQLLSDRLPPLPGEPVVPAEPKPSTPDEPIAIAEPAPARRPYKRRDNGKASR
jgi:hypothetical protein